MNKTVNIDSFIQVFESDQIEVLESFIKLKDNGYTHDEKGIMSKTEIQDFATLCRLISSHLNESQKNGYFLNNLIIAGIREQFDILRFSNDFILNIELKHDYPAGGIEAVKEQLLRHLYILNLLGKEVVACTYISSCNSIYLLNEYTNKLEEINLHQLIEFIKTDYITDNLLNDIDLSELIISPYSEPQKFVEHKYYLTEEQHKVSKDILKNEKEKIGIIGGPGTGKSLLLIDLAKKSIRSGKRVLLIFCASLPEAKHVTGIMNIEIIEIKQMKYYNLDEYDVLLIDEAQRLWKSQYEKLLNLKNMLVIFSVDSKQTLHSVEKLLNIEKKLEENAEVHIEKLKEKVRTDPQLSSFIKKFLHLSAKGIQPYNYEKVNTIYFNNNDSARRYIGNMCEDKEYISIELTEYRTKSTWSLKREKIYPGSKSTHSVIGREYNNVLIPLDQHFKYSEEAKLVSDYNKYYPYHEDSCVFEALTRVKENLLLVVVNNPDLYKTIQEILTWKDDIQKV